MTPEQIRMVESSSATLLIRADTWSAAFYEHLFTDHPDLRPLFPPDIVSLRAKFVEEIGALLSLVGDLDAFEARAGNLGMDHVGYGVRSAHYRASSAALVAAVADVLGDEATPSVLDAWRTVHDLVAEAMIAGAATVPLA